MNVIMNSDKYKDHIRPHYSTKHTTISTENDHNTFLDDVEIDFKIRTAKLVKSKHDNNDTSDEDEEDNYKLKFL